jgi:hypothetical protein
MVGDSDMGHVAIDHGVGEGKRLGVNGVGAADHALSVEGLDRVESCLDDVFDIDLEALRSMVYDQVASIPEFSFLGKGRAFDRRWFLDCHAGRFQPLEHLVDCRY